MKIAITSSGNEISSALDPRFGRARWFVLYDTESEEYEAIDNKQNLDAAQGAGIQSGQRIVDSGVEAAITGNVGPKAFRTLSSSGIRIYLTKSTQVQEAIESFKNGDLQETNQANVEGHWG